MDAERADHEPLTFGGLRVGVVGLGIEGIDVVRFLHHEGAAEIIVSDRKPADALRQQTQLLEGIPFVLQASANDVRLAERIDALFVSQGVPDSLPLLQEARTRGVPITAMMRVFLRRCPANVIGISGSAGKTTTTTLVGEMFRTAERAVFVGGNIGAGPLSELPAITPNMDVVLEMSHTQLERTERSPHLAAVLNVTPNHLDQFSWEDYVALKRNLVRHQSADDIVVLPTDNDTALAFRSDTPARPIFFGLNPLPGPGATVDQRRVTWDEGNGAVDVIATSEIRIPGRHNLRNVLAAVAIGGAAGLPIVAMAEAIRKFRGVRHRLETVAEVDGVHYIDDSIATAPERTIAALQAIETPIVLLLGGREKRLSLQALASECLARTRVVICFGEAGAVFAAALRSEWGSRAKQPALREVDDLPTAVESAHADARAGDSVLLAPAGTSFDAYENFAERGAHFDRLVLALVTGEDAHGPS